MIWIAIIILSALLVWLIIGLIRPSDWELDKEADWLAGREADRRWAEFERRSAEARLRLEKFKNLKGKK